MDDSNKPSPHNNSQPQTLFGMSAFGPTEREQFGQSVRLAMACIEAAPEPIKGCALPQDESSIRHRLKALSQEITSNHADLLELLVRFDNLQGWKSSGASHCAAWMNFENRPSTTADNKEYTRVYSADRYSESIPDGYYRKKKQGHAQGYTPQFHTHAFTYESPSSYGMTV